MSVFRNCRWAPTIVDTAALQHDLDACSPLFPRLGETARQKRRVPCRAASIMYAGDRPRADEPAADAGLEEPSLGLEPDRAPDRRRDRRIRRGRGDDLHGRAEGLPCAPAADRATFCAIGAEDERHRPRAAGQCRDRSHNSKAATHETAPMHPIDPLHRRLAGRHPVNVMLFNIVLVGRILRHGPAMDAVWRQWHRFLFYSGLRSEGGCDFSTMRWPAARYE